MKLKHHFMDCVFYGTWQTHITKATNHFGFVLFGRYAIQFYYKPYFHIWIVYNGESKSWRHRD